MSVFYRLCPDDCHTCINGACLANQHAACVQIVASAKDTVAATAPAKKSNPAPSTLANADYYGYGDGDWA